MTARPLDLADLRRYSSAHRIDMICDEFESALREGRGPLIEEYMRFAQKGEQPEVFQELLAVELDYLHSHPNAFVDEDQYIARFSVFEKIVRRLFSASQGRVIGDEGSDATHDDSSDANTPVLLSASPLFAAMPEGVLEPHMIEYVFAPGEFLMRQGDEGTSLMVIREGTVDVSTDDLAGERKHLATVGRGQVLGEMSLLTSEPRSASAVAVDRVRAMVLPAETFHELAKQYPELSVFLTNLIAKRLGMDGGDALTDKLLDQYRIKRRLGRGGMAVVYEAEDHISGQKYALKMMSHRLVYCDKAVKQFQKEADIIESFQHDHITRMYGRFTAFHTYFIVMEFCEGQTLRRLLENEGPPPEATCRVLIGQIASALDYAHRAGVIHRDIKPANIMIVDGVNAKLMDFGLAEPVLDTRLDDGRIVGTPRYMAPEQRRGAMIGKEADYFALGCVAYEMLIGKPLFPAEEFAELTRDFGDWHAPEFRELRDGISDDMCSMLQPSLRKLPEHRQLDLESIAKWAVET